MSNISQKYLNLIYFFFLAAIISTLAACGGGGSGSSNNTAPTPRAPANPVPSGVVGTTPYKGLAQYASNLQRCTYLGNNTQRCTLAELPFLGQSVASPTIEDVLDRTLVSHTWMGDNFRSLLQILPSDLLQLFRSITAVVIASDVRPAYYDRNTGAIYLDPEFLWVTTTQAADVSDEPDFRAAFGDVLQVSLPWRYVRNNGTFGITLNADGSRDLNEVRIIMAFLLYHELAHAIDFMHPSRFAGLEASRTAASYLTSGQNYLSNQFRTFNPLSSTLLDDLAAVSFQGATATTAQRNLQPQDLVNDFVNDGAIQYYAYTTQYEDFATLFETVMMSHHFGFEKDTAIGDNPDASANTIIAWGERGRLGGQALRSRALQAVQAVGLSNLAEVEAHINGLPLPTPMRAGETWGQNLVLSPQPNSTPNGEGIRKTGGVDYIFERVWIR